MPDEQPERLTDDELRQLVAVEYPDDPGDVFFKHDTVAQLVAEVLELRALLAEMTSDEPCSFDHHGYCQAHMWFEDDTRCAQARAADILGART